MRAPEEIPRRRRGRGSGRGRVILLVVAAVLFVLFTSLRGLAGFYTDYLWFDSVDLAQVWSGVLWSKVFLGAFFTLLFFVFCFVNLTIADRLAPKFRATGPEDDLLNRYHEVVDRRAGLVRGTISLLFGLVAGVGVSAQWNEWILFRNGGRLRHEGRDVRQGHRLLRLQAPVHQRRDRLGLRLARDHPAHHGGGALPERRHSAAVAVPASDAPGEGAHLGTAGAARADQGRRLLVRSLRADLLHSRCRRRRHLHRCPRPAAGDQSACC